MAFFSLTVLTTVKVNKSHVVKKSRYVTMVSTINLSFDGKRLLMVLFCLIEVTNLPVNIAAFMKMFRLLQFIILSVT